MVNQHNIKEILLTLKSHYLQLQNEKNIKKENGIDNLDDLMADPKQSMHQGLLGWRLKMACMFDLKHGLLANRYKEGGNFIGTIQPKAKPCTYACTYCIVAPLLQEATHLQKPNDMHSKELLFELLAFPCKDWSRNSQRLLSYGF